MEEEKILHACGSTSSKVPRLDYIPRIAAEKLAERYALGAVKHGKYNYKQGLTDKEYVLERCAHIIEHTMKYVEELEGLVPPSGDDNAAAIMWGGAFLCEADAAREQLLDETTLNERIDNHLLTDKPFEETPEPNAIDNLKEKFFNLFKGDES